MMCQTLYGVCVLERCTRIRISDEKCFNSESTLCCHWCSSTWLKPFARVCTRSLTHRERFVRFCSLYGKNSFQKESDEERQPTHIRKKRLGEKTLQKVCHRFLFALRHVFVLGSLFACLFRSFVRLGFDVDDKTHWWICFVGFVAHKLIVCPPNTLQHSVSSDN